MASRDLTVVLGSMNPGKIEACRQGLREVEDNKNIVVKGVATESGVPEQPMGLDDTVLGARNRARKAYAECEVSGEGDGGRKLGVGLESGLLEIGCGGESERELLDVCACAIYDGERMHTGLSQGFLLPPLVARGLSSRGYNGAFSDLGVEPDENGAGVLGVVSGGKRSRPGQMKESVVMATLSMQNQAMYAKTPSAQ